MPVLPSPIVTASWPTSSYKPSPTCITPAPTSIISSKTGMAGGDEDRIGVVRGTKAGREAPGKQGHKVRGTELLSQNGSG